MRKLRSIGIPLAVSVAILWGIFGTHGAGANWYVWKGATGTGAGTSWTNAWTDFNHIAFSSVSCGDTIWVAGNNGGASYTGGMSGFKTCTSGTPVTIERVTASDSVPVASPGWQSTFDSQVTITNVATNFTGAYWTLNGRTGDARTAVPYGIQFNNTSDGWNGVFTGPSSGSNQGIELQYVEVHGPACATSGTCNNANHALQLDEGGSTGLTVDHSWLHQFSEVIHGPYIGPPNSLTITNSYVGEDVKVTNNEHEDLLYTSDPCGAMTFINDTWYSSGNDGIFFDNAGCNNGFVMINNVFQGWGFWANSFGKTGTCGPYILLNNTFANNSLGSDGAGNEYPYGVEGSGGCTISSSSKFQNNIFYNTALDNLGGTVTYNAGTTSNGNPFSCGTGCFSYALASPIQSYGGFLNFTASVSGQPYSLAIVRSNFHLSSAGIATFGGKGTNLTSLCGTYPLLCYDKDGNARPSSGAWDLGAYDGSNTPSYTLTYTAASGGTISGTTPQAVASGGSGTTVTAVPNTGYSFTMWSDGVMTASRTDTNVMANLSVTASFAINSYTLTYTAGSNGTLTGITPQTVNYGGSGTAVTGVPNTGYHFTSWSDGVNTASRTDTNVQANISVTASFAVNTYTLIYSASAGGTIVGTTPQTVNYNGSGSTVTATPNASCSFTTWSDGVLTAARTDTSVTANINVTASFSCVLPPVGSTVTISGGVTVKHGTTIY